MNSQQIIGSRTRCVFRNLVHTVYREARHLGPAGDPTACLTVTSGPLLAGAEQCRKFRARLKSTELFKRTAGAKTTAGVLKQYQELTGLSLSDVIVVFKLPGWRKG
jgi:hypothetical protein